MTQTYVDLTEMLDAEFLEELDFEHQSACESYEGCSKAPDWVCKTKCCGLTYLLCSDHLIDWNEKLSQYREIGWLILCPGCDMDVTDIKFSDWISAVRL